MKKVTKVTILLIAVLTLSMLFTGCGGDSGDPVNANGGTSQTDPNNTSGDNGNKGNNFDFLTSTYKIPGQNIYVDVPNWQEIESGYTKLFTVHGQKYVTVAFNFDITNPTLDKVENDVLQDFQTGVANYSKGRDPIELVITKRENKTVNGMDVIRFEGYIKGKEARKDAFAVGYWFVKDNTPVQILGANLTDEPDQAIIDEVTKVVDAVIQTVRDEK